MKSFTGSKHRQYLLSSKDQNTANSNFWGLRRFDQSLFSNPMNFFRHRLSHREKFIDNLNWLLSKEALSYLQAKSALDSVADLNPTHWQTLAEFRPKTNIFRNSLKGIFEKTLLHSFNKFFVKLPWHDFQLVCWTFFVTKTYSVKVQHAIKWL